MSTRNRFRHDRSRYERPTLGWRCGRAAEWGSPCAHGPSSSGACGGAAACAPTKRGEAWQCRRAKAEGGPCQPGPGAEGQCGLQQPPCVPRRTLAVWRGRLSMVAVGVAFALITLFASAGSMEMRTFTQSSLDPGPLSAAHAHFASEGGCGTCHTAFGKGAGGWWNAFWGVASASTPGSKASGHELMSACLDCHGFGGQERLAHNQVFQSRPELGQTNCLMCHTEHRGGMTAVSTITEQQCQSCHTRTMRDFAREHPPFPAGFPYDHAKAIRFDHASHLSKHFTDARMEKLVPAGGCVGCHEVANAGRTIRPVGFDTACAGCHRESIARRDFVMFRWPEIEKNEIPPAEVVQACGVTAAELAALRNPPVARPAAAFSAVSVDPMTSVAAFLLGAPADDAADYGKPVQALARAMLRDGADPLFEAADDRLGDKASERLFAGLNSEMARRAACAWAANKEYEPPGTAAMAGWKVDALELKYAKPDHADPVLRSWIERLAALPTPNDAGDRERLAAARKDLLSASEGPGSCLKCHSTTAAAEGPITVNWNYTFSKARAHTRFEHRPHVDLLGPEKTCTSCHKLSSAPTPGATAFQAISLNTCTTCHAAGRVRDDCQLCHVYHRDHSLMKRMMSDAK